MLKLEAYITESVIDEMIDDLLKIGVHHISYFTVAGTMRSRIRKDEPHELDPRAEFVAKRKLEVILDREHLTAAIAALKEHLCDEVVGGAEVFVFPLEKGLRLAVGSQGEPACTEI